MTVPRAELTPLCPECGVTRARRSTTYVDGKPAPYYGPCQHPCLRPRVPLPAAATGAGKRAVVGCLLVVMAAVAFAVFGVTRSSDNRSPASTVSTEPSFRAVPVRKVSDDRTYRLAADALVANERRGRDLSTAVHLTVTNISGLGHPVPALRAVIVDADGAPLTTCAMLHPLEWSGASDSVTADLSCEQRIDVSAAARIDVR